MNNLIFKNIDKELEQIALDCLQGKKIVITKFGNASISNYGYYQITNRKEGNYKKYLHRLIWEDHYNKLVPEGYNIHHINGNKLDNRIQNLQCVEHGLHMSFHKKGENNPMRKKHHTEETKRRISENSARYWKDKILSEEHKRKISKKTSKTKNTTGFYRVCKHKDKQYKQGFIWRYRWTDENGKRKQIQRVNFNNLEKEVKAKGFEWEIIDEEKAMKTIKELNNEI